MSLVIISMMMIVVLNVVFADKEECSCNPQPPASVRRENIEGNVQPLGECMRYHIEKSCGPKYYDKGYMVNCWKTVDPNVMFVTWNWHWYRDCEKWGVWYDICLHRELYRDYLGSFKEDGWEYVHDYCSTCYCVCLP